LLVSADTWLLAGLGALALVFFAMTFQYRAAAALFPRIITVIVAALCIYELGVSLRAALAGQLIAREQREEVARGIRWHHALLAIAAYCALIYVLGFDFATLAFLIGFPLLTGYRRWIIIVIVAVVITVLMEVSFVRFLHVPLPKGWLPALLGW
jgi:putative tricarboxylic transport membrane protein